MKKYFISFLLIIAFAFYVLLNTQASEQPIVAETAEPTSTSPGAGETINPLSQGTSTEPTPTTTALAAGGYKDGSYTGKVSNVIYGPLQVEATISGGMLTDIQFLQQPSGNPHTNQVSSTALPQLKQEAIAAQSAKVNTVSGATQDSESFEKTLGDALAQAQS